MYCGSAHGGHDERPGEFGRRVGEPVPSATTMPRSVQASTSTWLPTRPVCDDQLELGELFNDLPVQLGAFPDQDDDVGIAQPHGQLAYAFDGVGVDLGGVGLQLGSAVAAFALRPGSRRGSQYSCRYCACKIFLPGGKGYPNARILYRKETIAGISVLPLQDRRAHGTFRSREIASLRARRAPFYRKAASRWAMRSSSAHTSAMRPEMTMRPAQAGPTLAVELPHDAQAAGHRLLGPCLGACWWMGWLSRAAA
jgi:hypothetical protein